MYLSSMDMVNEVEKGVFTASNCTKTLSRTPVMATVRLGWVLPPGAPWG